MGYTSPVTIAVPEVRTGLQAGCSNDSASSLLSRFVPRPTRVWERSRCIDQSAQIAPSGIARDINRDLILDLIRLKQPLTRAALCRLSGLRASTVSQIILQLTRENWVEEGSMACIARGRPSRTLMLKRSRMIFAVDVRPMHAVLAVLDLGGRVIRRENIPYKGDVAELVPLISEQISVIRSMYPRTSFEGVGISLPGRVHPVTHKVVMTPNLRCTAVDLKAAFEEQTSLRVEIGNDANTCLFAEVWSGRLGAAKNVVLVAVGEGVGTAILSGGQIYTGHNGLAGEFGHISVDPRGTICSCGQNGCWDVVASSSAAVRLYNSLNSGEVKDATELHRLASDGDMGAEEALDEQARALARGLRMIISVLAPELILIAGDVTTSWERSSAIIRSELSTFVAGGIPPELRPACDPDLARLSGSAALVMQSHGGYHHL
jgi:predicted NBD/HSP70 family sugar kinase